MPLTTWLFRKSFQKNDDRRDAGLTTPPDIERMDNICYGPDPVWHLLDLYRPKNAQGRLPVIVSVHGGGWVYGDKDRYQYYCMNLAQRGFAVVNFTYRLAPEFKFPAGIEDTHLVMAWVLGHGDWFDLNKVFLVGDSAGAHMATVYSAICSNPAYASRFGIRAHRLEDGNVFIPNAVALNCGIYQFRPYRQSGTAMRAFMIALLANHGDADELDLVNPVPYVTHLFPRAFIMTANQDSLAGPPAQHVLTERLEACHVSFVDRTYGTEQHKLKHVFHCDVRTEDARICNDEECDFFLER